MYSPRSFFQYNCTTFSHSHSIFIFTTISTIVIDIYYRFYQLLPFRSEGIGRRILFINPNTEWDTIHPRIRDKMLFYITYRVGLGNTSIQKEGIIIVSWMDSAFKISNHSINLLSVRISAIHICTNDIPYHGIPRSVVGMMIAQNRSRIKLHAGTLFYVITLRYCYSPLC